MPSEDPFHSGAYGTAVVNGVQWSQALSVEDALKGTGGAPAQRPQLQPKRYTKINAALKHFYAYSVESGRGSTDFKVSAHDIEDTYLPSFEAPIVQADAKGYMCAYTSVNGLPSCGSDFLSGTARNDWNFTVRSTHAHPLFCFPQKVGGLKFYLDFLLLFFLNYGCSMKN